MIEQETAAPPSRISIFNGSLLRLALILGGWVILAGGIQFYAWREMLTPLELLQQLVVVCRGSIAGPLLFIGAAALSPLLLIPAALLGGVAGICFGPLAGIIYTLVGCNLSALLTYSLGRLSRRGSGRIARLCVRYGGRIQQQPFLSVLLLRLSFLPYDPINYLIGLLHVRVGTFMLANSLGSLPGVIAIVLAGSALEGLDHGLPTSNPAVLPGALAFVVASMAVAVMIRRTNRPS